MMFTHVFPYSTTDYLVLATLWTVSVTALCTDCWKADELQVEAGQLVPTQSEMGRYEQELPGVSGGQCPFMLFIHVYPFKATFFMVSTLCALIYCTNDVLIKIASLCKSNSADNT